MSGENIAMKHTKLVLFVVCLFVSSAAAQSLMPDDLKRLQGREWVGELTYLDYSSNKKTVIKSNLKVTRVGTDGRVWQFEYLYPDEPKANDKSEVRLGADGRTFNDQTVIEKTRLANGVLKLVTTKPGTDNNKNALFRFTYLLDDTTFSIVKEVKVEGSAAYFERNAYRWTR